MTDRPIIFSAPMVRALLDGRKTMTRRVLKPQPITSVDHFRLLGQEVRTGRSEFQACWSSGQPNFAFPDGEECRTEIVRIPYTPGDRLYVRETVTRQETDQGVGFQTYAADGSQVWPLTQWYHKRKSIPSIHMPRWASRLTLIVTDVRVQRLQEISEADAVAEGVGIPRKHQLDCGDFSGAESVFDGTFCANHVDAMLHCWQILHGPGAWDANPWVVAISFTVQHGNIDQIAGAA